MEAKCRRPFAHANCNHAIALPVAQVVRHAATSRQAAQRAKKGESNEGIAKSILLAMDRMRKQRVKQLASRIAASALGLGGHRRTIKVRAIAKEGNWISKERSVWQEDAEPKYETCHAVVIESLRNYRPDELQTRRENRALMNWSAAQVRKNLEEACELHGLHLREVMPNYTSRQDSRTGLPGVRCSDIPVEEFLTGNRWRNARKSAGKRLEKGTGGAFDKLLLDLGEAWEKTNKSEWRNRTLRLPVKGGDLFVAAAERDALEDGPVIGASQGLQADLNAAANIGLRALLDPDFPGKWWFVLCTEDKESRTAVPRAEKVSGSACFGANAADFGALATGATESGLTNYWRDPSTQELRATDAGEWSPSKMYWRSVADRVARVLRKFNEPPVEDGFF